MKKNFHEEKKFHEEEIFMKKIIYKKEKNFHEEKKFKQEIERESVNSNLYVMHSYSYDSLVCTFPHY